MTLKKILPMTAVLALCLPAQALAAPKSKFRFAQATYVATEGQGSVDVTVTRIPRHGHSKLTQTSTVNYVLTGGTATQGTDYTLSPAPGQLSFPACPNGSPAPTDPCVAQTIHVGINQDSDIEGVETINFRLSGASRNSVIVNPRTAQVVIADDDGPTQIQLVPSEQSVNEGAGNAVFFAVRSGNTTGVSSSADYATSDGSATEPSDYTSTSGTANFAPGEFSKEIDVPIIDDSAVENSETFDLTLSNISGAVFPNSAASVTSTTTIVDNDSQPSFALDASSYEVNEDGSVDVTVNRLPGNPVPVSSNDTFTVDWVTSDGTATNPADYVPSADNELQFDSSDDSETITISATDADTQIQLIDDSLLEGDETFGLALANPSSNSSLGTPSSATVTIHDNDTPSTPVPAGDGGTTGGTGITGDTGAGSTGNQGAQIVLGARQSACGLVVKVAKKQKLLKKKALIVKLRAGQRCKVNLNAVVKELKAKKKRRQAQIVRALRLNSKKTSLTLQPGKAVTVKVKFTKKTLKAIKKALRARKRLVATVVVIERDASSVSKKRTVTVTVRR
jgi:Calx-beta domain